MKITKVRFAIQGKTNIKGTKVTKGTKGTTYTAG
jgi:hypothetical protein